MDRSDASLRVHRLSRVVERAVLDVMAHPCHHPFTPGLGIHERPAMGQLEVPVIFVHQLVVDVHVVVGETRVQLEDLEDRRDAVAFDVHDLPQPLAVHRARPPPLFYGQLVDGIAAVAHTYGRTHRTIEQMHYQRELPYEPDQRLLGEVFVVEVWIEGSGVIVAIGHKVRLWSGHLSGKNFSVEERSVSGEDSVKPQNPVLIADSDGVRTVTFNRPEARNAFNRSLYDAATEALRAALSEDDVRVVVLTGAGTAFSAGQDLKEMAAIASGSAGPGAGDGFRRFMDALCEFDKPLLAAVNGFGVGLGFTMLAHCDLVLVSDEARLQVPFAALGVPAEAASSYLFPERMGAQLAAEVLLTGRWLTADEAVASGIALRRAVPGQLMAETMTLAKDIARGSPEALRAIKRLIRAPHAPLIAAARAREDQAFAELFGLKL